MGGCRLKCSGAGKDFIPKIIKTAEPCVSFSSLYSVLITLSLNCEAIKSLWKGVWGITFLQKGFPQVSSASDLLERKRPSRAPCATNLERERHLRLFICSDIRSKCASHYVSRHSLEPDLSGSCELCIEQAFTAEERVAYALYGFNRH